MLAPRAPSRVPTHHQETRQAGQTLSFGGAKNHELPDPLGWDRGSMAPPPPPICPLTWDDAGRPAAAGPRPGQHQSLRPVSCTLDPDLSSQVRGSATVAGRSRSRARATRSATRSPWPETRFGSSCVCTQRPRAPIAAREPWCWSMSARSGAGPGGAGPSVCMSTWARCWFEPFHARTRLGVVVEELGPP